MPASSLLGAPYRLNRLKSLHWVLLLRRCRKFFLGRAIRGEGIKDISWFEPSGEEMNEEAWNTGYARCFGMRLAGDLIGEIDERGEPIKGDTILLLMNAHHEPIRFTLPTTKGDQPWQRLLDSADPKGEPALFDGGKGYDLKGRSVVVFKAEPPQEQHETENVVSATAAAS